MLSCWVGSYQKLEYLMSPLGLQAQGKMVFIQILWAGIFHPQCFLPPAMEQKEHIAKHHTWKPSCCCRASPEWEWIDLLPLPGELLGPSESKNPPTCLVIIGKHQLNRMEFLGTPGKHRLPTSHLRAGFNGEKQETASRMENTQPQPSSAKCLDFMSPK